MNVFLKKFLKSKKSFFILVTVYISCSDLLREIKPVFIIGIYLFLKRGTDCLFRIKIPFVYMNIKLLRMM